MKTDAAVPWQAQFAGKVALVAGGTGALGREISLAFLRSAAHVVATFQRKAELESLAAEANALNSGSLIGETADVSDFVSTRALVEKIASERGHLDYLVNAVGGYAGGRNAWEDDAETYEKMMALNLESGIILTRAVVPIMINQNRGAIVNIASRAGYGHSPGAALYSASKAAALAFFDSLADEVKPYAINVNSVVPSIFDTPANRRSMPKVDFSIWPKPADIAKVILFLCSDDARLIHGAAIPVYGRT